MFNFDLPVLLKKFNFFTCSKLAKIHLYFFQKKTDATKYAHYVFQSLKKSNGKKQCLSFEVSYCYIWNSFSGYLVFKLIKAPYDSWLHELL